MNIVLLYAGNSFNYGAFIMTANVIGYINREIEGCRFLVGANSQRDLERLRIESGNAVVEHSNVRMTVPSEWKEKKFSFLMNKLVWHNKSILAHKPACVIVLGGDDLSEYYDEWRIAFDLINLRMLQNKAKVFLVGQTIGPFHSFRKPLARYCLKEIPIYTRDPNNTHYLSEKLGLHHSVESSDLAFLDMMCEDEAAYSLDEYNLHEDEFITIVPSGLSWKYTSDFDIYLIEWVRIVENMLKKYPTKKIVLLPHVLHPKSVDDRRMIGKICEMVQNDRIVPITKEMLASQARYVLGKGYLTIAGRMHAAISTFKKGKPAISLSYSVKYDGIIGRDLGLRDLIVEASGDELWKDAGISSIVDKRMQLVEDHYEEFMTKITERAGALKGKARLQIDAIVDRLKKYADDAA